MMAEMPFWYYTSRPTNSSCHNLCTTTQPPANYRALLGLGLKFIPKPRYTNSTTQHQSTDRFRRDIYTKIFMAHLTNEIPRLYTRTDFEPPLTMINYNLQIRVNNFITKLNSIFKKRRTRSNMLPHQRRILSSFRKNNTHIVMNADKNLGPCIIEREQYIKRALQDHLLDGTTYRQLTSTQANQQLELIKSRLTNFIEYYKQKLNPTDIKYLKGTANPKDPIAKFYITAKIHKNPWKTRPIVSVCGSLLDGLG
jgi:hypothetical protein